MHNALLIIVTLPLAAALLALLVPPSRGRAFRRVAVAATGAALALALTMFVAFDRQAAGFQFGFTRPWLPDFGIAFSLGLDGVSLAAVLLAALVAFAGALAARDVRTREKEFWVLYLVLVSGAFGAFASTNLFFFYFFSEFEVLCAYLLIAGWGRLPEDDGRTDGASRAAMQMTLFVAAGAAATLLGLIALYGYGGTFDWALLRAALAAHPLPAPVQQTVFLLLLGGFGVLIAMWPLHAWTPPAYAAAPTAVSMFASGVLKQLGAYGLLRIALPLLPEGARHWAPLIAGLAIVNVLYAGWIALRQTDWKYLIGYASISHAGYILLGIAAMNVVGLSGVALMIFAGGLATALLFALAGCVEEAAGTREIAAFGGLGRQAPFIGVCTVMAAMAAVGLPGFAGFASEVMVFVGGWMQGSIVARVAVAAGIWGLVLAATYMLRAVRAGVFGPMATGAGKVADPRSPAGRLPYVLLLAALLAVGFVPRLLTDPIRRSVDSMMAAPRAAVTAQALTEKR